MADIKLLTHGKPFMVVSTGAIQLRTLDASTDAIEVIFQAVEDATITRLGVRLGAITGTTPTYRVSLQGVGTTGNPDGTILGGGTPASATFSPSGLGWSANTWHWITLDNSIAVTRGTFYAAVTDYSSGTVDGSNNASFTTVLSGTERFPYVINNNATVRARENGLAIFGYASATKTYGRPMQAHTTISVTSGTTPDEVATKFTLPAGCGDTYKILGVRFPMGATAGSSFKVILYGGTDATVANSTGAVTEVTVLQDVTVDSDFVSTATNGDLEVYFDETTLTTLYYGATYRLAIQPQTAAAMTPTYHDV